MHIIILRIIIHEPDKGTYTIFLCLWSPPWCMVQTHYCQHHGHQWFSSVGNKNNKQRHQAFEVKVHFDNPLPSKTCNLRDKELNFERPITPKPNVLLTHMITQVDCLGKTFPTICRSTMYDKYKRIILHSNATIQYLEDVENIIFLWKEEHARSVFHFQLSRYLEHNPKQPNFQLYTLFSGRAGAGEKKGARPR